MKMNKKLTAIMMAAMMAFGSTAAFAEITVPEAVGSEKTGEAVKAGVTLTATGTTEAGTININMPDSMSYILNPYKLENKEQVISPEVSIKNFGNTDIAVTLSGLTGKVAGKATLATTKVNSAVSIKQEAFLFLNIKDSEGQYLDIEGEKSTEHLTKALNTAVKASGFKAYTLGKLAKSATPGSGAGGVLEFKIDGNLNSSVAWAAEDKIEVVPLFTFAQTTIIE